MNADPGERRFDLLQVLRRKVEVDRAQVFARVIQLGGAGYRSMRSVFRRFSDSSTICRMRSGRLSRPFVPSTAKPNLVRDGHLIAHRRQRFASGSKRTGEVDRGLRSARWITIIGAAAAPATPESATTTGIHARGAHEPIHAVAGSRSSSLSSVIG